MNEFLPSEVSSPAQGTLTAVEVSPGDRVAAGQVLLRLESMKMEIPLAAPRDARVRSVLVAVGDTVHEGDSLLVLEALPTGEAAPVLAAAAVAPHPGLATLQARRQLLADAARPEAVSRRHALGRRTARENVADLLDAGSFTEYGAFAVAAQRSRRPLDELQRQTPADGLIAGTGTVDGRPVAVLAYDYTVLAGTQGVYHHHTRLYVVPDV
jgi:pyruvate/2-oxoglutarate dehydrogenase complex dihydrolipoamide acyltransferase (E2) component